MTKLIIFMGILIMPATLIADQMRVYCTDGGVITEHRPINTHLIGNERRRHDQYTHKDYKLRHKKPPMVTIIPPPL